MAFSSAMQLLVSQATVLQTRKTTCKVNNPLLPSGEEWFRIKREVEQQTLAFLATGHSHFWENKNWGVLLLPSSLFIHSQEQLPLDGVRDRYRTPSKKIYYHLQASLKAKKSSSMAGCLPRSFCWALCLSRECLEASVTNILMQGSCKSAIWTRF